MTRRRGPRRRPHASPEHGGEADLPALRLRQPADVLGAIPYIVGYHPHDSVVVLAARGTHLVFTARDDLPRADSTPQAVDLLVQRLARGVLIPGVTSVVLVGYGCDAQVRPVLLGLRDAAEAAGLAVREALRAADGRYWSYLCHDVECCPIEGTPFDVSSTNAAAQATLAGRVVLADRTAFEAQIEPVDGPARSSMREATVRADDHLRDLVSGAVDEAHAAKALTDAGRAAITHGLACQRSGARLTDDDVAWLTVLLSSIPVRDIAWARITGDLRELEYHRALWMDVTRRVEPDLVMAPGSLFAFASWRCGETALARLALQRVLDEDPVYTMAVMIANSLDRGLPPSVLADWPGDLQADDVTGQRPRRRPDRLRRRRSSSRREGSRRA